ncbi:MAG: YbbR-like domain-containing protein [Bacteroidota bacterium]
MRWFASNLRTFFLALILGVAVWVSAVSAADPDEAKQFPRPIPIEIIGQDSSLILTNEVPPTMNVSLRAPRSVWDNLVTQDDSVRAILDLTGLGAGEHQVDLKIQVALRPTQIIAASPKTVTVDLESFDTKPLDMTLSLTGQPAAGYQVGEATMGTKQVVVSGPASLVKEAARARVAVNLDGIRESITNQSVPIQIFNAKNEVIKGLTLNPETVRVGVPISQQSGYRDLAVKVIVNGQQAAGYRLENIIVVPQVVTVVSKDPALVSSLPGVVETRPLDLQDAKEDISTRLALDLPEGVTLIGPQTVQVQVSITPIQNSITLANLPINVVGLAEGLSAQVDPRTVDVILSGPVPVLEKLTAQDVVVTVDVSQYGVGSYQLTPKVDRPANVTIESILPSTVEVVLSPATATPTPFPNRTITPTP